MLIYSKLPQQSCHISSAQMLRLLHVSHHKRFWHLLCGVKLIHKINT